MSLRAPQTPYEAAWQQWNYGGGGRRGEPMPRPEDFPPSFPPMVSKDPFGESSGQVPDPLKRVPVALPMPDVTYGRFGRPSRQAAPVSSTMPIGGRPKITRAQPQPNRGPSWNTSRPPITLADGTRADVYTFGGSMPSGTLGSYRR